MLWGRCLETWEEFPTHCVESLGGWVLEEEILPAVGKGVQARWEGTGGVGQGSGCHQQGQEHRGGVLRCRHFPQHCRGSEMSSPPPLGQALAQQWGDDPGRHGPGKQVQLASIRVGQMWGARGTGLV